MWRGDFTHGLHKGSETLCDHPDVTPMYACGRWALPSEVGPGSFFNAAGGEGEMKNVGMQLQALTFTFEGTQETIPVYVFFTGQAVAKGEELLWDYTLNGEVFQSHSEVTNAVLFGQPCFEGCDLHAFGY